MCFLLGIFLFVVFYEEMGRWKVDYEEVYNYKHIVFWSFRRDEYQKTNWWAKTASMDMRDKITIRTANIIRKLVNL